MGLVSDEFGTADSYEQVCFCCGFPLTKYNIAAEYHAQVINYLEHKTGQVIFVVCPECLKQTEEFLSGGADGAYRRLYADLAISRQKTKELSDTTDFT